MNNMLIEAYIFTKSRKDSELFMPYSMDRINRLLKASDNESGASDKIREAAEHDPAIARAIGNLSEKDMARISAILNDKQAIQRIMSSQKARELLRKFGH